GGWRAFLWSDGQMVDLATVLLPGSDWVPQQATGINDLGQISCLGLGGTMRALVLTPLSVALPPAPAAPSNLTIGPATKTQLSLTWPGNSTTGDNTRETGFEIERSDSGGPFRRIAAVVANVISFVDTGLSPGTPYVYRVHATNAGGASANSNEAGGQTLAVLPSLTVQPEPITGGAAATGTVTLDFPAPTGGAVLSPD